MTGRFEGKIFHLDPSGALFVSAEEPFALEADLERLVEQYPELLPGDQLAPEAPRPWLVARVPAGAYSATPAALTCVACGCAAVCTHLADDRSSA